MEEPASLWAAQDPELVHEFLKSFTEDPAS